MSSPPLRAIWGLWALLGICQALIAQENVKHAVITLRVTDTSGVPIEGAEVHFLEQAKQEYEVKRTDKTGRTLTELKPGTYMVTVTAAGFKSHTIERAEANPAEHKQLEVTLQILPPVPDCCADPVEPPPVEPEHIESRTTEVLEHFQLERISDGMLCSFEQPNCPDRGIWWKDFTLHASDGHRLDLMSIPFRSTKRAKREFRKFVKGAQKIIRREPERNDQGKIGGERALGLFVAKTNAESPGTKYWLFWTWDKYYWALNGEHLEDVLALEHRLRVEGTNAVWGWH